MIKHPSLEVITIFFRTTFTPFLSICRFYRLFSLKNKLLKVVAIFPSLKVITPLKSMVVLIVPISHLLLLKLGKPKVSMILLPIFKKKWMNSTKIIKTRILLRFPIILLNSILDIFHSYP